MKLLVDIGNSRVKWTLAHGTELEPPRICAHAACAEAWTGLRLGSVLYCSVAQADDERRALAALGDSPAYRVRARAHGAGVINGYHSPGQLGADRWASLLGARALWPGQNLVIVDAGSALTVDGLRRDGQHVGGAIMAGYHALRAGVTAAAPILPATGGAIRLPARSTEDALETGAWWGLAGAVERLVAGVGEQLGPFEVLLTGGDAGRLRPLLPDHWHIDATLALRGLLAAEEAGCAG